MEAGNPLAARVLASRYRVGSLLGRGGMAEVYDAYDERLDRPVAVKLLRPAMAADPEVRARFEVEARSAASLSHPNVVAVFDTGEDAGTPFIVMERLPGETLADRMAGGPVDEEWLRRLAGDVLAALRAAHATGLVHRDVKPGNILIAADGCAKVADFGIAKSIEPAGDTTGTGLIVGTPAYLAPERLEGEPATERSDLYALGVVLYEALAGVKPFDGATPVAVADAVLHGDPKPLPDLRPGVDPALVAAVEQAMSRDPAHRPGSALEFARLLRGAGGGPGAAAGPDPTVADATLVERAPRHAARVGSSEESTTAPVAGAAEAAGRLLAGVPRRARIRYLAGAGLVLVAVLIVLAALGGGGRGTLATDIDELAARVATGDGPNGPAAAERLTRVGAHVRAGGGADEANALLADAARWTSEGTLSVEATRAMASLLARIDGVDPALATPTTVAPTTGAPTTVAPPDGGDEDEAPRGKKKRGKEDD